MRAVLRRHTPELKPGVRDQRPIGLTNSYTRMTRWVTSRSAWIMRGEGTQLQLQIVTLTIADSSLNTMLMEIRYRCQPSVTPMTREVELTVYGRAAPRRSVW